MKPGSKHERLEWTGEHLVVSVRARAVEGQANEAVRRDIAAALRIAQSAISLQSGARSRKKLFRVEGLEIDEAIARLRAKLPPHD